MDFTGCEVVGSFTLLPQGISVSAPRLIYNSVVPKEILERIVSGNNDLVKHVVKMTGGHLLVLERYYGDWLVAWEARGTFDGGFVRVSYGMETTRRYLDTQWKELGITELIGLWKEDITTDEDGDDFEDFKLDMIPFGVDASITSQGYEDTDPHDYLERKYYESLLQIRTPLAFFVKSKLARLRNMCTGKQIQYKDILQKLVFDLAELNHRHSSGTLGLLTYSRLGKYANELRDKYIIKEYNISMSSPHIPTYHYDIALILKVREIKLQIILILELIVLNKLDGKLKDFESKYREKFERRSLNIIKSSSIRRRRSEIASAPKETPDLCEHLDILLDKLAIVDILLSTEKDEEASISENDRGKNNDLDSIRPQDTIIEQKRNMLNKGKELSSMGFVNYVLVPYWLRRIPNTITFIKMKIKGPGLQNCSLTKQSSTVQKEGKINTPTQGYPFIAQSPECNNNTIARPPLLKTRANSNLVEFLESDGMLAGKRQKLVLSKTTSDLTLNRLERRQLSVSQLVSSFPGTSSAVSVLSKKQGLLTQSFQRVGKRKLEPMGEDSDYTEISKSSTVQVTATPAKELIQQAINQHLLVVESPVIDGPPSSVVKITDTPSTKEESERKKVEDQPQHKHKVRRRLFAP